MIRRIPCLVIVASLLAGAAIASAEEFNRSYAVTRGTALDVRLFGGGVTVRAWERDEVRIRGTHFRTDVIDVQTTGRVLQVKVKTRQGAAHAVDLDVEVPAWMAVTVKGTYLDIAVSGTTAAIAAETVRGDVTVQGGGGSLRLSSIEGQVSLEEAKGNADLRAVNNDLRVSGLQGDLLAETVNGSVTLRGVVAASVTVGTVGGDIDWDGPLSSRGRYAFATHHGDIDISLPEPGNAAVAVRLFDGDFHSAFPTGLARALARPKRFTFTIGAGSSHLELETFRGVISLRRSGQGR